MGKDKVFNQPREASDFKFGNEVVTVFDDMVSRSVPFYGEIQRMIAEIVLLLPCTEMRRQRVPSGGAHSPMMRKGHLMERTCIPAGHSRHGHGHRVNASGRDGTVSANVLEALTTE